MMQDEDGRADLSNVPTGSKTVSKADPYRFILILVIPLIFLLLMFGLESKIVYLTLWIISLIVLAVYLICVEIYSRQDLQTAFLYPSV